MDVGEKSSPAVFLELTKTFSQQKGSWRKKISYRKAFEETTRLGVMDGTGENGVDAAEVT
jgi:hypothetical protein